MKVVALVSGGKDSCYAVMKCIHYGHEIVALANLMPADDSVDELDSYMYQTVGHQIIVSYAECMGLPLFRRRIQGSPRHEKLSYQMTSGDEVEDLFVLLSEVKRQIPSVTAVSSGAIASDYQRLRVESVCSRLGLISLAYLWKQDQSLLLQEMITSGIVAITVKVASMGLDPAKHLGKELASLESHLHKLKELYGMNVCGEGGEYETLTLDCPLFVNARIMLDDFEIVLHSSDSIAPVGVIHPLKFHLEKKGGSPALSSHNGTNDGNHGNIGSVFQVQGDSQQNNKVASHNIAEMPDLVNASHDRDRVHASKTMKDSAFSLCCWLDDSHKDASGLEEDLKLILKHIESQLNELGFGWGHVLYIHLYIADMNEFATANETYVRFIMQEKCPFGVPSRSTIEIPLIQAGFGRASVEVLVANDQSKNVLHVQSISSWAPSCIGPYSQATLHNEVLHMAGQLGLDPPTMTLPGLSPAAEMEQALRNSEALAKHFNSSISTSAILFTIYCSAHVPMSDRVKIEDTKRSFLDQLRQLQLEKGNKCKYIKPLVLYLLVPDLPKRAMVEVKPILFVPDDVKTGDPHVQEPLSNVVPINWGFQHTEWHDSIIQKCVVRGRICAVVLSITNEHIKNLCTESLGAHEIYTNYHNDILMKDNIERVSMFCVFLLNKVIVENLFFWEDVTSLRVYFPTSLEVRQETISITFKTAFIKLAEVLQNPKVGSEPIFNMVPILGAGRSAESLDNVITCELFATKS